MADKKLNVFIARGTHKRRLTNLETQLCIVISEKQTCYEFYKQSGQDKTCQNRYSVYIFHSAHNHDPFIYVLRERLISNK
jgi:hypothetical protein